MQSFHFSHAISNQGEHPPTDSHWGLALDRASAPSHHLALLRNATPLGSIVSANVLDVLDPLVPTTDALLPAHLLGADGTAGTENFLPLAAVYSAKGAVVSAAYIDVCDRGAVDGMGVHLLLPDIPAPARIGNAALLPGRLLRGPVGVGGASAWAQRVPVQCSRQR